MKLDIHIDRDCMGINHDAIKNLLRRFQEIEIHKNELDKFNILLEIGSSQFNELGVALIWRLSRHYQRLSCEKEIRYSENIKPLLEDRHFLDRLTGKSSSRFSTDVPIHYEVFSPQRNSQIQKPQKSAEDVYRDAIKSALNKGDDFHDEIGIHISEVINNAFDHSEYENEAGIVCVKEDNGFLTTCAVDMGQGIKKSFLSNPRLREEFVNLSDEEAISQATKYRVSCNPVNIRHPKYSATANAGIGLYYLQKFVEMHKDAQLIILSGKGYYYIDNSGRRKVKNFVDVRWPGTLVFFKINMKQALNERYRDLTLNSV
jgi:hypothetical protein